MPLDIRLDRSPQGDELARLTVDRLAGPGGEPRWSVTLVLTEGGAAAIPALPAVERWPRRPWRVLPGALRQAVASGGLPVAT